MKDHPVVSHLVKLRVTMEKLRPLDAKLKYQIDKLLKLAASASKAIDKRDMVRNSVDNEDGLNFRPDVSNLVGPSGLNDTDKVEEVANSNRSSNSFK